MYKTAYIYVSLTNYEFFFCQKTVYSTYIIVFLLICFCHNSPKWAKVATFFKVSRSHTVTPYSWYDSCGERNRPSPRLTLTTLSTHKRQISEPLEGFENAIPATGWTKAFAQTARTLTSTLSLDDYNNILANT